MLPSLQHLVRDPYFDNYLVHLKSDDLNEALDTSESRFVELLSEIPSESWSYRYAPEKWSIEELVLHTIETEIIFNYRALRIARESTNQLIEGFDENEYVVQTKTGVMSPTEMIHYFKSVRNASRMMVKTFSENQLTKVGIASGKRIQVAALFYIVAGHTLHHAKVLEDRYLLKK